MKHLFQAALALLLVTGGILAGRAVATGVPAQTPLTWGGVVTDAAGKPYAQGQDVQLRFYDQAAGGTAKCVAPVVVSEAWTGRFQAVLPPECVQVVHDVAELWSEATVGAGKTVLPRVKVGAVPYALEAGVASGAGGALKAQIDGLEGKVGGGAKASTLYLKLGESKPFTTSSSTVVLFYEGSFSPGINEAPPELALLVDGKVVVKPILQGGNAPNFLVSGTAVSSIGAGAHSFSISPGFSGKSSLSNPSGAGAGMTVLEL